MSSFENTQIYASVHSLACFEDFIVPLRCAESLVIWCVANNTRPVTIVDCQYGVIMAFPSAAWSAVFGVDLDVLFNGEAA